MSNIIKGLTFKKKKCIFFLFKNLLGLNFDLLIYNLCKYFILRFKGNYGPSVFSKTLLSKS